MTFLRIVVPLYFLLNMIFSESRDPPRYPSAAQFFFRIMLQNHQAVSAEEGVSMRANCALFRADGVRRARRSPLSDSDSSEDHKTQKRRFPEGKRRFV
jgi:hypothetical protein